MFNWPEDYGLPQDHCLDVLQGAYDVPYEGEPIILDIGANIGAFARWAKQRWPKSVVHCYEPNESNYALLGRTVDYYGLTGVHVYPVAVAHEDGQKPLHHNGPNCGEWSLAINAATHGEPLMVPCVDAASLPDADIVKVDTEGAEPLILSRMAQAGKLNRVQAVMLEYHAATVVSSLTDGLVGLGFRLLHHDKYSEHRGVLRFMR